MKVPVPWRAALRRPFLARYSVPVSEPPERMPSLSVTESAFCSVTPRASSPEFMMRFERDERAPVAAKLRVPALRVVVPEYVLTPERVAAPLVILVSPPDPPRLEETVPEEIVIPAVVLRVPGPVICPLLSKETELTVSLKLPRASVPVFTVRSVASDRTLEAPRRRVPALTVVAPE